MAKIFPDLETILLSSSYRPSESELTFMEFLTTSLSDEFELFYKPLVNGDSPDLVLLKKNTGVLIFNILEHAIKNYRISDDGWHLRSKDGIEFEVLNPFERSKQYKDNLYHLHIEKLQDHLRENKNYYSIVNCGTFFSNDHRSTIPDEILNKDKYHVIITKDDLNVISISQILQKAYFNRVSNYFNQDLYASFKRYLLPPIHKIEEGKSIIYTEEQERFIPSNQEEKRIHGVAGSGKTLVLARRAVNAHIRTKKRVLILTFNKTLRNYIRDRINDVREEFPWSAFTILHYHEFFRASALNLRMKVKSIDAYDSELFFEHVKDRIVKYDTLIIDEIQDYKGVWFRILKKYFLVENGEFVVFGDGKQDIYQRKAMDTVPIQGRPSSLKKSYRLTSNIAALATRFQEYFFTGKHDIESIEVAEQQLGLFEKKGAIEYYSVENVNDHQAIYEVTNQFLLVNEIHPSDAAIISARTEIVAELDFFLRTKKNEKTTRIFEPIELRRKIEKEIEDHNASSIGKNRNFATEIDRIRDNLKRHFEMNSGLIKLSSIHSFKGWETDTVFLLIEGEDISRVNTFTTDELIYVGLTRAKRNLVIINLNNEKYGVFFEKLLS